MGSDDERYFNLLNTADLQGRVVVAEVFSPENKKNANNGKAKIVFTQTGLSRGFRTAPCCRDLGQAHFGALVHHTLFEPPALTFGMQFF